MTASEDGRTRALADYLDAYLSPEHRDNVAEGCPMTAAASEIARQDRAVGARFSEGFERTVGMLQTAIVGGTTASTAAARQRATDARDRGPPAMSQGVCAHPGSQWGRVDRQHAVCGGLDQCQRGRDL